MTRRPRTTAATVAVALILAACGGGDDNDTEPADVDDTAAEPADAPESTQPDATDAPAATDTEPGDAPPTSQPAVEPPADIADSNIAELARLRYEAGGDTVETALMAFTMQFGGLPGIYEAPEYDGLRAPTGTGALEGVIEVWDELDEPTRDAIRQRINDLLGDPNTDGSDENAAGIADEARLMSFAPHPNRSQLEWEMRMQTMATAIRSRLGGDPLDFEVELVDPSSLGSADATTSPDLLTIGASWAEVLGIRGAGSYRECHFLIGAAQDQPPLVQEGVAAHEMFHCWSITNAASVDSHIATPKWFQEGIASWVGETLAGPNGSGGMSGYVRLYLRGYNGGVWPLYLSSYEALGFWYWVQEQGVDLWGVIPNLFTVAQTGENDQLLAAVDSFLPGDGLMSAGSAPVLEPGWGPAWTMSPPGATSSGRQFFEDVAQRGNPSALSALPGMQGHAKVNIQPPVAGEPFIFQFQGAGWGRARWASGEEITMAGESVGVAWCVGGECVCPDGSAPSISFTSAAGAEGPVTIGLQGGPGSSSDTRITILSMDDVCDPVTCPATDAGFERASPETSGTPLPEPPAPAEVAPAARPDCVIDLCMVGTWVAADVSEVEAYLTTLYRAAPVTPVFERGTMGAQFFDDGTALFTLDAAWGATAPTGEDLLITTVSETDVLWSADGGALEYTVLQIRQDTTIEAGPVLATGPPVIGGGISDPVGTGSVSYSCEDGAFVIEGGVAFFPLPSQWVPA